MDNKYTNPFPVNTYYGKEYFCDRESEKDRLISNMQNGISTTILAIRRIGKTGLIHHTLSQLPKNWEGIYIDILETENLNSFLNLLASSILNSFPEKNNIGKLFWDFIKSLRPVITYDTLTGAPQASFDIKPKEAELSIQAILKFLDNQKHRIIIAIDEFQQITQYPEKNTDAWLRSRIQQLKNITFIFSGSQQHLMTELFTSPNRPFYRSTQLMKLEKIDKNVYRDFIVSIFNRHKKEISPEIAEQILEWTNGHTFYVQLLCNRVFSATTNKVNDDTWRFQASLLLKEQEPMFFMQRNMLTKNQWHLLKALAQEEKVYQPTSKTFLIKYKLGTSASVLRSLNTLLKYELVFQDYDSGGSSYYCVYDVFIQRWVNTIL